MGQDLIFIINDNKDYLKQIAAKVDEVNLEKNSSKILVCNKIDLRNQVGFIDKAVGEQLADQLGAAYYECSARTGLQIEALYSNILKVAFKEELESQLEDELKNNQENAYDLDNSNSPF